VDGHAHSGPPGADTVCALVSVLTRSALRTLSNRKGIELRGAAPGRGRWRMEADYGPGGREFLAAVGAFLIEALRSVSEEYPGNCGIEIENLRPPGGPQAEE
jgi:uncharacterized protein YsxB (DUF464 family)